MLNLYNLLGKDLPLTLISGTCQPTLKEGFVGFLNSTLLAFKTQCRDATCLVLLSFIKKLSKTRGIGFKNQTPRE